MTSDGKFGQDIICARIQKTTAAMLMKIDKLESALKRIRDCDWVIALPDRMDAVRAIAREALE